MNLMERRRVLMGQSKGSGYAHGTLEDLFWHIDKGDYATEYALGEEIDTKLKSGSSFPFQIVAFNADTIADTTEKAPVTLISTRLYAKRRFNPAYEANTEGTGTIGGWWSCELLTYFNDNILPNIPDNVQSRMLPVKKYTRMYNTDENSIRNQLTIDLVWLHSFNEMVGSAVENTGANYRTTWFTSNQKRIKKYGSTVTAYFLRTAYNTEKLYTVAITGSANTAGAGATSIGCPVGFCVG